MILGGSDPFQVWSVIREDYLAEETRVHIRVEGRHTTFATTARVYTYSVLGEHDLIGGVIPSGEYLGGVIMCADELSFLVLTHNLGPMQKWYRFRFVGQTDPAELIEQGTFDPVGPRHAVLRGSVEPDQGIQRDGRAGRFRGRRRAYVGQFRRAFVGLGN